MIVSPKIHRQNEDRDRMVHISQIMPAESEPPHFAASEQVVPRYIRGKRVIVERVIEPEEGFGRYAGSRCHYHRLALPMSELWPAIPEQPTACESRSLKHGLKGRDMTTQAHQHEDRFRV